MKSNLKKAVQKFFSVLYNGNRTNRSDFIGELNSNVDTLEIGPFTNPLVRGDRAYYFDVLTREELLERAKIEKYIVEKPDQVPKIDFVSYNGDLSIIDKKFDQIVSSHCIEHQPDLIKHLNDAYDLLNYGGRYFIIMPDRRYCFDAKIPATHIGNVVEAYTEKRKVHSLANVISYYALTTHNKPLLHWLGKHGHVENISYNVERSLLEFENSNGSYIDVHAWRFQPEEFVTTINTLKQMKLINFKILKYYKTAFASNEFYVVLEK